MDTSVYSVSTVTAMIREKLEHELPVFIVEGEVSNFKLQNSGHRYFTLSDAGAKINVTFFANAARKMGSELKPFKDGEKVKVTGKISVYAPHGSYQLNAVKVESSGVEGELLIRFEQLKRKLFAEGLCDDSRKKKLPALPRKIGVVTAPTGAVIHDIMNILERRYPSLSVLLAPVHVQGTTAANEIARAITILNEYYGPDSKDPIDAMIIGRGGGSLEDLWAFNEPVVAYAVIASKIPVISAVGHEPDYAISDFVADVRAPTPSAAAELICGKREDFINQINTNKNRLLNALRGHYKICSNKLKSLEASALFRDPCYIINTFNQKIDNMENRLDASCNKNFLIKQNSLIKSEAAFNQCSMKTIPMLENHLKQQLTSMQHSIQLAIQKKSQETKNHEARLNDLNPYSVLARGYSLTKTADGKIIKSVNDAVAGTKIITTVSDGEIVSQISEKDSE